VLRPGGRADLLQPGPHPEPYQWSRTTYKFHDLVLQGQGNKTLALQGGLLQEVVTDPLRRDGAQEVRREQPSRTVPPSAPVVPQARQVRRRRPTAKAPTSTGSMHMQTAAVTLLGDDMKNKRIVDLFD